jgi:hypothetical protein
VPETVEESSMPDGVWADVGRPWANAAVDRQRAKIEVRRARKVMAVSSIGLDGARWGVVIAMQGRSFVIHFWVNR